MSWVARNSKGFQVLLLLGALSGLRHLALPVSAFVGEGSLDSSQAWKLRYTRVPPRVCVTAIRAETADLENMRKRELIELLTSYNVDAAGLTKPELVRRIRELGTSSETSSPISQAVTPSMSQREVAEIAMDDWQNATTVGFDCKSGRHIGHGVEFDIIGPSGQVEHRVRFSEDWPPVCTCADARAWGSQLRCKHVCMILVKCGVPYAAVADGDWKPGEMEIKSIVNHMKGKWTPIPLQDA